MAPAQWRASITHIDTISKLLRTLTSEKTTKADLCFSSNGLKVQTISSSRICTAQLFLESSLFASYECCNSLNDQQVIATLSISALVNCLVMFGEWSDHTAEGGKGDLGRTKPALGLPSAMKESGRGPRRSTCFLEFIVDQELKLSFAHESMTSVCAVKLLANDSDFRPEVTFDSEHVVIQAIMPAMRCTALLRDLEAISANDVEFGVQLDPPQLEIRGFGELANAEMVLVNEANVLDTLVADGETRFRYSFAAVNQCSDAVKLARKVSLRIDASGTLSVQCLCQFKDISAYIEFRVLANL